MNTDAMLYLVQSDVTLTSIDIQRPARAAAVRSGPVADSTDTLQYPTAAPHTQHGNSFESGHNQERSDVVKWSVRNYG